MAEFDEKRFQSELSRRIAERQTNSAETDVLDLLPALNHATLCCLAESIIKIATALRFYFHSYPNHGAREAALTFHFLCEAIRAEVRAAECAERGPAEAERIWKATAEKAQASYEHSMEQMNAVYYQWEQAPEDVQNQSELAVLARAPGVLDGLDPNELLAFVVKHFSLAAEVKLYTTGLQIGVEDLVRSVGSVCDDAMNWLAHGRA